MPSRPIAPLAEILCDQVDFVAKDIASSYLRASKSLPKVHVLQKVNLDCIKKRK